MRSIQWILAATAGLVLAPPLAAQDPVTVTASRTGGVAPLAVFFDLTDALLWEDIESSKIHWDFDDGVSFNGFMAAHVFELDDGEAARDYVVRVEVSRNGGIHALGEVTISVAPFSGTTYCVSNAGAFDGCPAGGQHRSSVHTAWDDLATGNRLLLRRGEFWELTSPLQNSVDGPVTIGVYGPSELPRPHLDRSATSLWVNRDWRLLDVEITGLRDRSNGDALIASSQADDQLYLRVKANDVPNVFAYQGDHFFFVDGEITGTAAYGLFMGTTSGFAVLGSSIKDNDLEHCIRTHGSKVLIANNYIHSKAGSILKIAGNTGPIESASEYVLIANNHLVRSNSSYGWAVGIGPENRSLQQYINKAIVDGNRFSNPDSAGFSANTVITADDVTVRNNVFLNSEVGLLMLGDNNRPKPHSSRMRIYNNTFSSTYPYFVLFRATENNHEIFLHNNLVYATPTEELFLGTIVQYGGSMSEIESDHHLFLVPGATSEFEVGGVSYLLDDWQVASGNDGNSRRLGASEVDHLFVDIDGGDGLRGTADDDLHLLYEGAAVDVGASLPLAYDLDLQPRPAGVGFDVGAYEFQTGLFMDGFESGDLGAWQ